MRIRYSNYVDDFIVGVMLAGTAPVPRINYMGSLALYHYTRTCYLLQS